MIYMGTNYFNTFFLSKIASSVSSKICQDFVDNIFNEGNSVPGIAHGVVLEVKDEC